MNQTTKVENHILPCGMCDYVTTIFEKHIFSDIVKCEMVLMDENDKLETDKVDMISANLIREAYPVCYGVDTRWANHLYPIFLTESFCKSKYVDSNIILNLF